MRDPQFHGLPEEVGHGGVQLPAAGELESRAARPVVNEDADKLLHDRFGILHQLRETTAH